MSCDAIRANPFRATSGSDIADSRNRRAAGLDPGGQPSRRPPTGTVCNRQASRPLGEHRIESASHPDDPNRAGCGDVREPVGWFTFLPRSNRRRSGGRPSGLTLAVPEVRSSTRAPAGSSTSRRCRGCSTPSRSDSADGAGTYYPVLSGLEPGQRVATAGAVLLDAETRLNPSVAASYFGAGPRGIRRHRLPPPPVTFDRQRHAPREAAEDLPGDRRAARLDGRPGAGEPSTAGSSSSVARRARSRSAKNAAEYLAKLPK